MKKKERKYLNKKDINTNFLGTIISYKRILVYVNLLIWNLVITNSKWANASYSAYGQTKSGKNYWKLPDSKLWESSLFCYIYNINFIWNSFLFLSLVLIFLLNISEI